jgi:hypothetical protein
MAAREYWNVVVRFASGIDFDASRDAEFADVFASEGILLIPIL